MPNIYNNEYMEYAGNHYYKSDSGLLLEAGDRAKSLEKVVEQRSVINVEGLVNALNKLSGNKGS